MTANGRDARILDEWTNSKLFNFWLFENKCVTHVQVSISDPIYPPSFLLYANASNVAETSKEHPLSTPMMIIPLFVWNVPTNSIPQPTMVPKSNNDPSSHVLYEHGYTHEETLKIPRSYSHTHQYSFNRKDDNLLGPRNIKK